MGIQENVTEIANIERTLYSRSTFKISSVL